MAHYYTADLHLCHENIIRICNRPYAGVDEMNAALIENIRSVVTQKDDLWIVGDLAMCRGAEGRAEVERLFRRIPGRKHLITGNHDKQWVQDLGWTSVAPLREIKDEKRRVTLCHYPLMTWPGSRHGALQLFGHVHDNWEGCRGSVNVGVDLWGYRPVTYEEIQERSNRLPRNLYWDVLEPGAE